jgi:LuxR family maltose regulon positive regulatory protein
VWSAANAARAAGVELVEINATGHLALLRVLTGAVTEAAQLATDAADLAERRGWRFALQTVAAHLAHALVALERHHLDDADRALRLGLRAHHSDPEAAQRLVILGVQARLATARGDYPKARRFLAEAAEHRSPRLHTPAIDRRLELAEAHLDLATGHPDKVEQRYAARPGRLTPAEQICRARAAYITGDLSRAELLLAAAAPPARDTVAGTEAGVLAALIADSNGHRIRATDLLADTIARAERDGIRRPFAALAEPRLDRLLNRLKLLSGQDVPLDAGADDPGAGRAVEDLSARETEILRYLTTMLTAAEIAADLGVSVNTVKAHMRAVYRKLGASRRSQAVTLARDNGIL